jgi:hypothetical protein
LVKVEKAGATALFQQEGKGSNNIGVVVNPVRLNSLTEFGTPQFVADRLLQAEKKKVYKCLNNVFLALQLLCSVPLIDACTQCDSWNAPFR